MTIAAPTHKMRKIEERRPNNNFAQGLLPQQVSGQFFSSKDCINFLTLMASIVDKQKYKTTFQHEM